MTSTTSWKKKFSDMIEDGFRYIKTESAGLDFNDTRPSYLATSWASVCVAVIEKWVENDFDKSQEFINGLLIEIDAKLEDLL